jgi:C4-dicarboxylate-specific signal transduction histidine kinase
MAIRRQHIASQLHVLQEAVASAVHELSQPLNVVNLLADNALEDVATLQAEGAGDPEVLSGLRRRVESIVEQSGKASDITRWIRAFAVSLAEEPAEFDPDVVIERIAGIFTNDLRVAGISLVVDPVRGRRSALGNETLLAFALTETMLWITNALPNPAIDIETQDETSGRQIRIVCVDDAPAQAVVLEISSDVVGPAPEPPDAPVPQCRDEIAAALPMLGLIGQARGSHLAVSWTSSSAVCVRLSLPRGEWQPEP